MAKDDIPFGGASRKDTAKAFFYAGAEADLYDATVDLTQAKYDELHRTLLFLLKEHFRGEVRRKDGPPLFILDCG